MSALRSRVFRSGPSSGKQGDADADRAVDRDVLQGERLGQRSAQLDRDSGGLVVVGVAEQDRELIAAQAHQQVPVPQVLAQAGADLDQQLVPHVMAQAVVDLLEPVQVQHQQRLASMLRVRNPRTGLDVKGPPVRQARQVVGGGLLAQHVQVTHLAGGHLDRPFEGVALGFGFVVRGAEEVKEPAPSLRDGLSTTSRLSRLSCRARMRCSGAASLMRPVPAAR